MKKINKIIGVGKFKNFIAKGDIAFKKLNLIYAENAMGKSTLTNIFRSLSKNDPKYILTKTDDDNYRVEVLKDDNSNYIFYKKAWKNLDDNIIDKIEIYDKVFIENNIHSGFIVNSDHKKRLTKFIIGENLILENNKIEEIKKNIGDLKIELKNLFENKIKNPAIKLNITFQDFEEFKNLDISGVVNLDNINNQILEIENNIENIKNKNYILNKEDIPYLKFNEYRPIGIDDFKNILEATIENIEKSSENKLKEHLENFNKKIDKNWLYIGFYAINDNSKCPFCGSDVNGNQLIKSYQDCFNLEYNTFKKSLLNYKNFGQNVKIGFININSLVTKIQYYYDTFWNKYLKLESLENLTFKEYLQNKITFDFMNINSIDKIVEIINNLYNLKEKSLLDRISSERILELDDLYKKYIISYDIINKIIKDFYEKVINFKKSLNSNVNINEEKNKLMKLKQKKYKYCIENNLNFENNMDIIRSNDLEEILNKNKEIINLSNYLPELRNNLSQNIQNTIITYKDDINDILKKFNTSFKILLDDKLKFNTSEPTSELSIKIGEKNITQNNKNLDIYEKETIGNALSEGDKTSLAFAFFIAKLKHDKNLNKKIIIFDDPMCSLDKSRKIETINQIKYIFDKAKSVFILSHDSYFLEDVLKNVNTKNNKILHIFMNGNNGSNIKEFDLKKENQSSYFKSYYILKEFLDKNEDLCERNNDIAKNIRIYLEGLLRRIYPDKFNITNSWLGDFIPKIKEDKLFSEDNIKELEEIKNFSKRFHHDDSNENQKVDFTELSGFVRRTLNFVNKITETRIINKNQEQ